MNHPAASDADAPLFLDHVYAHERAHPERVYLTQPRFSGLGAVKRSLAQLTGSANPNRVVPRGMPANGKNAWRELQPA